MKSIFWSFLAQYCCLGESVAVPVVPEARSTLFGQGGVRGEVGDVGEAIEHERGHSVLLVHRRQPHDLLHRVQDAGLIVELADDLAAFRVRADDEAERAVGIHMVVTALGIILDDEDDGVAAEAALGDRFDDLAEGEVVVGDLGLGRAAARRCGRWADRGDGRFPRRPWPGRR